MMQEVSSAHVYAHCRSGLVLHRPKLCLTARRGLCRGAPSRLTASILP